MFWDSFSRGSCAIEKPMTHEVAKDGEFLIYSLIYWNELAYLQLIKVMVNRSSPPKSHEQGYLNFSINIEKYVWMNSFLGPVFLLKFI